MPTPKVAKTHAPEDSGPREFPQREVTGLNTGAISGPQPMQPARLIPPRKERE